MEEKSFFPLRTGDCCRNKQIWTIPGKIRTFACKAIYSQQVSNIVINHMVASKELRKLWVSILPIFPSG